MLDPNHTLQAVGYEKVRLLFPEADEYRLAGRSTRGIEDGLVRFDHLFPRERYGLNRTMKKFEDSSTWFKDLDPMVALEVREEMRRSSTAVDGFPVGSPVISRAMSPSSVGSTSSFRGSPSFLAPVLPREVRMDKNEDSGVANRQDIDTLVLQEYNHHSVVASLVS
jgi:hypothetical protein